MRQTLYLIRHTTPDIAPGVCYGQLDIGVGAGFAEEARQALHWLPQVELFLTSPLARAARLAELMAQTRQCELKRDARLMEKHFGSWEGRRWDSIERGELDAWAADLMGYAPPGGESARALMQRVQELLRDVMELPQQSIAIVSHAGAIRALLAHLGRLPLADTLRWEIAYGSVIGVRY